MKKIITIALIAVCLAACTDARKTIIPQTAALENKDFVKAAQSLKEEEKQQLTAWIMRKAFEGGIPAGVTIESALTEQSKWQAEQNTLTAKRAEDAARLNKTITWKTTDIQLIPKNIKENRFSDGLAITMDVTNNSDKPIKAAAVNILLTNALETKLGEYTLEFDEPLAAHEQKNITASWEHVFDTALINALNEGKPVNTSHATTKILYEDGTKDGF